MEHLKRNTRRAEWYTPNWLIKRVRVALDGIELDPASCEQANESVMAGRIYTLADDGLAQSWRCETLFLNPPFARDEIDRWIVKLARAHGGQHIGQWIALVNNSADTRWGQSLLEMATAVCFLRGRVRFEGPHAQGKGARAPLQGQMVVYGGDPARLDVDRFSRCFGELGVVFETTG